MAEYHEMIMPRTLLTSGMLQNRADEGRDLHYSLDRGAASHLVVACAAIKAALSCLAGMRGRQGAGGESTFNGERFLTA